MGFEPAISDVMSERRALDRSATDSDTVEFVPFILHALPLYKLKVIVGCPFIRLDVVKEAKVSERDSQYI